MCPNPLIFPFLALLLALAPGALDRGVDPEAALRGALRGYAEQVRAAETQRT